MSEQPSASSNYAFCPECGSPILPTDRACRRCGTITPLGESDPFQPRQDSTIGAKGPSRPAPVPPSGPDEVSWSSMQWLIGVTVTVFAIALLGDSSGSLSGRVSKTSKH